MKVVLIQPPVRDFYDTQVRLQPLGLCLLKAVVEQRLPGMRVTVLDGHHGRGRRTTALPPALEHLAQYYPAPDRSPFSTFHQFYHFGASHQDLAAETAALGPDLVGISSQFSAYHREVLDLAQALRSACDAPLVVGGSHASAAPETLLADPNVDFVIRGEGERPLVELVRCLAEGSDLGGVPNLVHRVGGQPVFNPVAPNYPLPELPAADFSDLPPDRYRFGKRPLATLTASRGCPHHCNFCSVHATFGTGYRRRPVASILEEIALRHAQGYRAIDFEDDNLTLPGEEMAALCRGLIEHYPEGELTLQAMNGVSYLSLDETLLGLMRRAGFSHLNLSLVSVDAAVCRRSGRPHSPDRFQAVVRAAHRLGFRIVSYQILGLPGESLDSMIDGLVFGARLPVLLGASPFYLPPGSPLAAQAPPQSRDDLVRCRLTALGRGDHDSIYTLFVSARILNFLKGLPMAAGPTSLRETLAEAERMGGRTTLGADLLGRLLREGVLYAAAPAGLLPLPRFRSGLFRQLWNQLDHVSTQSGGCVAIGDTDSTSPFPPKAA